MAVLTQQFLQDIGVQMDDQTAAAFSQHFEETLSERILDAIIELLDEQQVEELATMKQRPETELQAWLLERIPDLKEVIEDEVAILMGELVENSDQI